MHFIRPPKQAEIPILDYLSHQTRLFPLVAETYALQNLLNFAKDRVELNDMEAQELHILASGVKPVCTWFSCRALQIARECCGGQGFHAGFSSLTCWHIHSCDASIG